MSRIWQALKQAEAERARVVTAQNAPSIEESESEGRSFGPLDSSHADERRKGLRHAHDVVVLVYGSGAGKHPFHEECETIDANDRGCLLTLESAVSRGQRLFLTNTGNQAELECRVVYIGRRVEGKARVGIEFLKPSPEFWRLE